MKHVEYAAAEYGYENEAEWTRDREEAQWNVDYDRNAGLDSHLIERTVNVSKWREATS